MKLAALLKKPMWLYAAVSALAVVLMAVVTVALFKFLRAAWRRLSVFLSGSPKAV